MIDSTRPATAPTGERGQETESNSAESGAQNAQLARIGELEAKLKEAENKYLYLYAEFENYKKRMIKERSDQMKYGWESLARDLLQVIDNLERALAHMPEGSDKTLIDGLNMVLRQFRAVLEKQGVQTVETVSRPFDPHVHEAVGQEHSEEHPEGTVTKEHQPGYTLHGRLLRPARVTVSTGNSIHNGS